MQKLSNFSLTPESKWLTTEDFEQLCFNITRELMSYQEPIPDYTTRENSLLDSALSSPRQTFGNKLLYPTLPKQAAILFYSLIKNHPFKNGNKRIAVMALVVFLYLNNKWISVHPVELYQIACKVSNSSASAKSSQLITIEKFIEDSISELV